MKLEYDCSTKSKVVREYTQEEIDNKNALYPESFILDIELSRIRTSRNALLTMSDWTQVPDSPLTSEKKTEWATYRQLLRDLPASITTLQEALNVTFPTKPI